MNNGEIQNVAFTLQLFPVYCLFPCLLLFFHICFYSKRLKSSDLISYLNSLFAAKISGAIEECPCEGASLYSHCSGTALALGPQRIPVSYLLHMLSKERESHASPSLDMALVLLLACCGNGAGEVRLFSLISVAHKLNSPYKGMCLCQCARAWRGRLFTGDMLWTLFLWGVILLNFLA